MTREEAKTTMSKLIDVFRKEYPNGGAFAAIHATGGHNIINKIYDAHEAELKAKDECIAELEAKLKNMCAECECAKFADNAIKPSEMWKLHLALKDNK